MPASCKKQYLRKLETSFNIIQNKHRKDVKEPDAILAYWHFHLFNKHAKFMIIDQFTNNIKSKDILRQRLIEREHFGIQKLETLLPQWLNQELST